MTGAETAYLRAGWAFLDDPVRPPEQREYLAELRREDRAARARLLTAVSRLDPPGRDALRAYLVTGLRLDVLAALLRVPERTLWTRVVAAGLAVLPVLDAESVALLPVALCDALADAGDEREELVA